MTIIGTPNPAKFTTSCGEGNSRVQTHPHTPYYGTADATPLYLITLHSAWICTGDRTLLTKHLDTAERCLDWIDRYGDRDGDGFQEYQTRSPVGYENQGWKDSGDAVMNVDGSLVKGPKALCELQGYVYDAWLRMAHIYEALGKGDFALKLRRKAARYSKSSTRRSGTRPKASTLSPWTARRGRSYPSHQILGSVSGQASCRLIAPGE